MISYCVELHTPNRCFVSVVPRSLQLFVRWFLLSYKCEQNNLIGQVTSWMIQESQFPSRACFLNLYYFVVPHFQRCIFLVSQNIKPIYCLHALSCGYQHMTYCTHYSYGIIIEISTTSFFWEHLASLVNSLSWWDIRWVFWCTSLDTYPGGIQFCVYY